MNEYCFLFVIAFLWTLFATIQDIKHREVSNWLNFSLIAIALAYRAFLSISQKDEFFFISGVLGFALCFGLAHAFYYSRTFAGGDAKLLMAFGVILPYKNYFDILPTTLVFILILFFVGAIYSLIYSGFIASKNKKKFVKELKFLFRKTKYFILISTAAAAILFLLTTYNIMFLAPGIFLLIPIVYIYTKAVDKCMRVLTPASKLTEGDWIERDIKLKNYIVKKTVHGLSLKDIQMLKKYKKQILVKQGVPFVPAFLLALIITLFVFLVSKLFLSDLISTLF